MAFRIVFTTALPLLVLGASFAANAVDVHAYERFRKQTPEQAQAYLTGVGEGLSWANAALVGRGEHPLYCVPNTLSLNANNYSAIVESELASSKSENAGAVDGSKQVELVLFLGLLKTFPCPK